MFTRMLTGAIAAGALSIPLAGVASAEPPPKEPRGGDVAVSVNGTDRKLSTDSTAISSPRTSTGGANVAVARNNSIATATDEFGGVSTGVGTGNRAFASNNSFASAEFWDQ